MTPQDWYRRTTWTSGDAGDFEAKLARARGSRSEYLRIQALTLVETDDPNLAVPALELAQRYLQKNPFGIDRAQIYTTIARALALRDDVAGAVDAYRNAVEAEK